MDFSLPRKDIIRSRNDIQALLDEGRSLFKYPVKVVYRAAEDLEGARMMVSVPKRNFKRAVKRNLLKRRIREAFRLNRSLLLENPRVDIMFVYSGKEILDYAAIESSIKILLARIGEQLSQKSA